MYKFNEFINSNKTIRLIHTTTDIIAKDILIHGFKPKSIIDFKYYSDFGKDGIYFYDNKRQAQNYAYFLKSKIKCDIITLIYCDVPQEYVKHNDNIEDGYFVSTEYLETIKIISHTNYKNIKDIY